MKSLEVKVRLREERNSQGPWKFEFQLVESVGIPFSRIKVIKVVYGVFAESNQVEHSVRVGTT